MRRIKGILFVTPSRAHRARAELTATADAEAASSQERVVMRRVSRSAAEERRLRRHTMFVGVPCTNHAGQNALKWSMYFYLDDAILAQFPQAASFIVTTLAVNTSRRCGENCMREQKELFPTTILSNMPFM